MKNQQLILCFLACFVLFSCTESLDRRNKITDTSTDGVTQDTTTQISQKGKRPTCAVDGVIQEGNEYWSEKKNQLIRIVSTKAITDTTFKESHRLFRLIDGATCEVLFEKELPVDGSPDFGYYFAQILYNSVSEKIAIRGFQQIFIFDFDTREITGPLQPEFINERYAVDAQSGAVQRLELWEDYLVGYARDKGGFVYDLNENPPKVIYPYAEYAVTKGEDYHSLFLLPFDENTVQAIAPTFDRQVSLFEVNPLFEKPLPLAYEINKSYRNNRFQIFRSKTTNDYVAVDMLSMEVMYLPEYMRDKKVTEVIEWLKR